VERAVSEWGHLDIMVNNAGASFRANPEDISINGWNTVVQINLNGVFLGCKWAGKQMMQQKTGGTIVNISSVAGVYGSTMMSHYGASKAAVITLTRELGTAWGRKGIRVNCIAPGPVETEGYLDVLKQAGPDGKKTYDATCSVCHGTGVAGAPKLGDKAAWAPRLKTGIDTLHASAIKGKGAMPAKGGNASLSDADVMAAVESLTTDMFPGVVVVPVMSTGATDGLYFRNAGIPTFGVDGTFGDIDDGRTTLSHRRSP